MTLKIGDKVTLSKEGLQAIGGLTSKQMLHDNQALVVTGLENINPPGEVVINVITVDKHSINRFILVEDYLELRK